MARLLEETEGSETAEASLGDLMHFRGLEQGVEGLLLCSPWSLDIARLPVTQ